MKHDILGVKVIGTRILKWEKVRVPAKAPERGLHRFPSRKVFGSLRIIGVLTLQRLQALPHYSGRALWHGLIGKN